MTRPTPTNVMATMVTVLGGCGLLMPDRLPVETDASVGRPPPAVGCGDWAVGNAVSGVLEIAEREGRAETWIRTPDDQMLRVIWPEGFSVVMADPPALHDDRGVLLFRDGGNVELSQVGRDQFEGSAEDPVVASGQFGGGCWVRLPDE